uniref:Uncharacterized protein n=1 Tax=Plectus sambesii TaxID=2011161 RepID=A0A914W737_9BILA
MNEPELPCGAELCDRNELTTVFEEGKNAQNSSSTPTGADTSASDASGGHSFVAALEANKNEEVEMCVGHSDSSSDADEPMSTVELLEEDANFSTMLAAVVCDGLLAESLAYDEQLALQQTIEKDNSDSSGMSSPDDLDELEEIGAGHISGDATLDFLDMDIDPRDLSASSSPLPLANKLDFLDPVSIPAMVVSLENDGIPTIPEKVARVERSLQATDEGVEQKEPGSTVELVDDDDDLNLPSTSSSSPLSSVHKAPLTCVVACAACLRNATLPVFIRATKRSDRVVGRLLIGGSFGRDILHQLLRGNPSSSKKPPSVFSVACSLKTVYDVFSDDLEIPQSGCGLFAVLNVLCGLEFLVKATERSVQGIADVIAVKSRALQAPLDDYLLSRSVAGTTHIDLIRAVESFTNGQIRGRFFSTAKLRTDVSIVEFVGRWIESKAAPILTLNLQREITEKSVWPVADAWHHQTAVGVAANREALLLDYPREVVDERRLRQLLTGSSTLLVRWTDVVAAWDRGPNLTRLIAHAVTDQRWIEMNVVGQVMSVIRQANEPSPPWSASDTHARTSHISIPAAYTPGVSVFARSESLLWREIQNAPSLE